MKLFLPNLLYFSFCDWLKLKNVRFCTFKRLQKINAYQILKKASLCSSLAF